MIFAVFASLLYLEVVLVGQIDLPLSLLFEFKQGLRRRHLPCILLLDFLLLSLIEVLHQFLAICFCSPDHFELFLVVVSELTIARLGHLHRCRNRVAEEIIVRIGIHFLRLHHHNHGCGSHGRSHLPRYRLLGGGRWRHESLHWVAGGLSFHWLLLCLLLLLAVVGSLGISRTCLNAEGAFFCSR